MQRATNEPSDATMGIVMQMFRARSVSNIAKALDGTRTREIEQRVHDTLAEMPLRALNNLRDTAEELLSDGVAAVYRREYPDDELGMARGRRAYENALAALEIAIVGKEDVCHG